MKKFATRNTLVGKPGNQKRIGSLDYWHAINFANSCWDWLQERKGKHSKNVVLFGYPIKSILDRVKERIGILDYIHYLKTGETRASWKHLKFKKKPILWDLSKEVDVALVPDYANRYGLKVMFYNSDENYFREKR